MSGGTNQKIKDQNKAIEKQYKYDRRLHDYTSKTNVLRYDQAVADTKLQQANLDVQQRFKNALKRQEFSYQSDLQQRQFDLDKQAYRQSLEDYDAQRQLNSMGAALAKEAAQRKQREALISKNFDLEGQSIDYKGQKLDLQENRLGLKEAKDMLRFDKQNLQSAFTLAKETRATNLASLGSKEEFEKKQAALNQKEITEQKTYVSDASKRREEKLDIQTDKLNEDISYLDDVDKIDVKSINLAYDKQQASNYNKRIDALIEREKAEGKARASGREGRSAERERTDALADYGRSQAALVETLVFAKDEKTYALGKGKLTKDYQKTLKGKDKDLISKDKNLETLSRDRELGKLDINSSKISNALEETVAQIGFDKDRTKSAFRKSRRDFDIGKKRIEKKEGYLDQRLDLNTRRRKLTDRRNDLAKRQIRTTFDSARAQFMADKNKIKLDEYSANLAAQGQVLQRPMRPVALPKPLKTPRTLLPMPQRPFKAPKPIKGALGKTSVWNDVGDIANVGLSIAGLFI
tara:strand:+ start:2485 stop:4047 length:1563 start_codon:yes stop_codon:yes gene_type:complete